MTAKKKKKKYRLIIPPRFNRTRRKVGYEALQHNEIRDEIARAEMAEIDLDTKISEGQGKPWARKANKIIFGSIYIFGIIISIHMLAKLIGERDYFFAIYPLGVFVISLLSAWLIFKKPKNDA